MALYPEDMITLKQYKKRLFIVCCIVILSASKHYFIGYHFHCYITSLLVV